MYQLNSGEKKKRIAKNPMIDLSRIRSLKTLDEMTRDLNEFLTNPYVLEIYVKDYGWDKEDYEDDKADVIDLLERIVHRRASLERHLKGQGEKQGSRRKPKSEKAKAPSAPQPSEDNG